MKNLLLVVLTWMVLAGASRAQDGRRAGDFPAAVIAPEPGMVTLAVEKVRTVAYRLAGRALGSLVATGMNDEQVEKILGKFNGGAGVIGCCTWYHYRELDLTVVYEVDVTATGIVFSHVRELRFNELFR
jgi:hypothetical protein